MGKIALFFRSAKFQGIALGYLFGFGVTSLLIGIRHGNGRLAEFGLASLYWGCLGTLFVLWSTEIRQLVRTCFTSASPGSKTTSELVKIFLARWLVLPLIGIVIFGLCLGVDAIARLFTKS